MVDVLDRGSPSPDQRPVGKLLRNATLPVAALAFALFAAAIDFKPGWFDDWRTGVLFAVSAVVIVAGQAFLTQYFEARAARESLLWRIREKRAEVDALMELAEDRGFGAAKPEILSSDGRSDS